MSAFKHFDVARYLEDAKSEAKARTPAKIAKAAKDVATVAGLAGVQTESSSLEGSAEEQPDSPAATTFSDPFNTGTQPKAAAGSIVPATSVPPAGWATAAAKLQQMKCPPTVSEDRWQQVRSDAARLLDWAGVLGDMGWSVEDVFGRDDLDRKSLAWLVCGQRIGPITKVATVLRGTDGSTTWVYRRAET